MSMGANGSMTEDEAKVVAEFAAKCVWDNRDSWGPIMRYGRLFTPGTDAGGTDRMPALPARNACRLAMDSGLLYAEGYVRVRPGLAWNWAWCLDGETVVDPQLRAPATTYFGVALRPEYVRRVYEERQRYRAGDDGFRWVFQPRHEVINPPLDPAADIVLDLGRDIPSWVREWALTAGRPSGDMRAAEAWVVGELLKFPNVRAPQPSVLPLAPPAGHRAPGTDAGLKGHDKEPSEGPLPVSYARYLIRSVDWFDSGMALVCSGRTGGVFSDDATILKEPIQDGDGLDTLIRIADEHRARCEGTVSPGGEREHPGLAVQKHAEVHLKWVTGSRADHSFAVLHRLDHNVWDAWLHPSHPDGQTVTQEPPVRLTRNGVSYEMALTAAFRAMGEEMPEEFAVVYPPFELPAGQRTPEPLGPLLPMSYARNLIRRKRSGGMRLACVGQTGGSGSDEDVLTGIPDGESLDTLIRMADEHRMQCTWAVNPNGEREHPELTVQRRAAVHLKWVKDVLYANNFAVLRHLDHNDWDAWHQPWHLEGQIQREGPAVRLMRNGVSYEMALMAVFRAMGEEMPEEFQAIYIYEWPARPYNRGQIA